MGNSQSNEVEGFIKEQQKIIEAQQLHINQLSKLNNNNNNNNTYKNTIPVNNIQKDTLPHKKDKINMILKIFNLDHNYNEESLKKSFLKLAMVYHPDKGGDPENFKKIQSAYKILLKKLSEKDNHKIHNQFKNESQSYISQQQNDNLVNVDLSKDFNNDKFNKIYDENRLKNNYDEGYGKWMEENKISDSPKLSSDGKSFNSENFNLNFIKEKQKQKGNFEISKYNDPKIDISFKGKDSLLNIGEGKVSDFSGESGGGLQFRDYKDAYTNSCLIDTDSVDISGRSKDVLSQKAERSNISYTLSDKDSKIYEKLKQIKENNEEERLKRIKQQDKHISSTYHEIHKRLLGR